MNYPPKGTTAAYVFQPTEKFDYNRSFIKWHIVPASWSNNIVREIVFPVSREYNRFLRNLSRSIKDRDPGAQAIKDLIECPDVMMYVGERKHYGVMIIENLSLLLLDKDPNLRDLAKKFDLYRTQRVLLQLERFLWRCGCSYLKRKN